MANLYNINGDRPVATGEIFMIPNGLIFTRTSFFLRFRDPDVLFRLMYGKKDSENLAELIQKNYEAIDLRSYDNQPIRLTAPTEYDRTYVLVDVVNRETCGRIFVEHDWVNELPAILQSDLAPNANKWENMPPILPLSVLSGLQEGDNIDFYINGKVARLTARCYPCRETPSSNGWLYI